MVKSYSDLFERPLNPALVEIKEPFLDQQQVRLYCLRLEQLFPENEALYRAISGNKYFKLKYNILQALKEQAMTLLSFGGAYSNHIYALAAIGKLLALPTIGVIRGESCQSLNPVLACAEKWGMHLIYLNREQYRKKHSDIALKAIASLYAPYYLLPEGGSNALAVKGCAELLHFIPDNMDTIALAVGTGGTMAGIIQGLYQHSNSTTKVLGFSVLKGDNFLTQAVRNLLSDTDTPLASERVNWQVINTYHFGGYAKVTPLLRQFMDRFEQQHALLLDPVYTAKMLYGIYDMVEKGRLKNTNILCIHTGGLIGRTAQLMK